MKVSLAQLQLGMLRLKRQLKKDRNIPRRIVRLLGITGIGVVLAMVSLTFWMSRTVDELSRDIYQKMVDRTVLSEIEHLRILTERNAALLGHQDVFWAEGQHTEIASTLEWLQGGTLDDSAQIGRSFVIDGTDLRLQEQVAEDGNVGISPTGHTIPSEINPLLEDIDLETEQIPAGFITIDGQVAAFSAARIETTTTGSVNPPMDAILVNIVVLDEHTLLRLADVMALKNLELIQGLGTSLDYVEVPLLNAPHPAFFTWESPETGSMMFRQSLGAVAAVCLLTALGHIIVGRIAMRLAEAFSRESHEARNDRLTGLLNRKGIEEMLESKRVLDALDLNRLALVILDMDQFKAINDTYGHSAGDAALQQMSERIQSINRRNDIAGRMGGDEFLLIILDDNPRAVVTMITGRLAEAGNKPVPIGHDDKIIVQASMGAAISKPGMTMRELMMAADRAMYDAKIAKAHWKKPKTVRSANPETHDEDRSVA